MWKSLWILDTSSPPSPSIKYKKGCLQYLIIPFTNPETGHNP